MGLPMKTSVGEMQCQIEVEPGKKCDVQLNTSQSGYGRRRGMVRQRIGWGPARVPHRGVYRQTRIKLTRNAVGHLSSLAARRETGRTRIAQLSDQRHLCSFHPASPAACLQASMAGDLTHMSRQEMQKTSCALSLMTIYSIQQP
jgi:hypothetical protein